MTNDTGATLCIAEDSFILTITSYLGKQSFQKIRVY